eukprot:12872932-Alexandrium_andersonii.AAC.1
MPGGPSESRTELQPAQIPSPWPSSECRERVFYRTGPLWSKRVGAEAGVLGKTFGTFVKDQQCP